jgi:small-conductance mechanosensitive channel
MLTLRFMRCTIQRLLLAFWLAAGLTMTPALAQQPAAPAADTTPATPKSNLPPEVAQPIERMSKGIESAEQAVQQLKGAEGELGRLRVDVETILKDSNEAAESLRPRAAALKDQIEKLGPPPEKDQPAEAPAVAAERARLNAELSEVEGAIKTTELTWVRARQLILRITELRHALFTRNLFEQQSSPVLPPLWRRILTDAPNVATRLSYVTADWLTWVKQQQGYVAALLAGTFLLWVIAKLIVRRLTRRPPRDPAPPFIERAVSAARTTLIRVIPVVLAALLLYGGLDSLDLLYQPWEGLAFGLLQGVLIYIAISTLLTVAFAIREPDWRLFDLSNKSARRICRLLQGIALVFALDLGLTVMTRAFYIPLSLTILQSFITCLAYAGLLIGLLLSRFQPYKAKTETETVLRRSRHEPRWLKLPLWVIAFGIIVGAVTGYVALARFIAHQLVTTGVVFLVVGLLYLVIRAATREPVADEHPFGALLEQRFGLDPPRRHQLAKLTELSLALVLGLCALPVIMLQWGFSGADIRDWFSSLLFGFEIGQFRISLARILIGLLLFTALLLATRLFQRWLRDRVLAQPRMDAGIANSIDTVVGYAGIAVAALVAVSYAGFDITSLAIVAGALSVGIGFGLQSIVNNFVSGLILLVERPIKVGDWIVVGNEQGHVRRISVRATEIETFDRASLIVPNSELIMGRVVNWTHRNLLGRVVLKISTDYGSDPEKVIKILEACATDNQLVLKSPAPSALLEGFGANSLDFVLRFLLADLNRSGDVQSEMRTAIMKAFRANGINLPQTKNAGASAANELVLKVSAGTTADPEKVMQILLDVSRKHPAVQDTPPPKAVFEDFGHNGQSFALIQTIDDRTRANEIQTELRIAILNAFRANGIEMSHGQYDIHLRDLDSLRVYLARAAEERRNAEKAQTSPLASAGE